MERPRQKIDYPLFWITAALLGFGTVFLFMLSTVDSLRNFGTVGAYFSHQFFYALIPALVFGFLAYRIPLAWFKKWAMWLFLGNFAAMFLVFIPGIGVTAGGASRWVNIGGISGQPSEFLKVTAILYLASWIASRLPEGGVRDWKHGMKKGYDTAITVLVPFLVLLVALFIVFFLQSDASTLGIVSLSLLALYFAARTPLWHTGVVIFLGAMALFALVRFESYRLERWLTFLNPTLDPLGSGYQATQSIISLGSGGLLGKGLGMSNQKFGYLPEAMTDSIFAIIGEEIGFIGCMVVVALFLAFVWRGIRLYKNTRDPFARLTAVGLVSWIGLQTFVNMASSMGMFPLTGIPLPFFSYGGSHLVAELIAVGLLLNISRHA